MATTKFIAQFKTAMRVSIPLITVRTPDPAATIENIKANVATKLLYQWDVINGIIPLTDEAQQHISEVGIDLSQTVSPSEALIVARRIGEDLPQDSTGAILFYMNAQLFIKDRDIIQAMWNLRDHYKTNHRALVNLVPEVMLPIELTQDMLILDEPFPTNDELAAIATTIYEAVGQKAPDKKTMERIVDATCGIAAFPAESAMAMSITENGMDIDALWERKCKQIEQIKGLSVMRTNKKMKEVLGLDNITRYFTQVGNGPKKPKLLVLIDEIDKHMANFGATGTGDTTAEMAGPLLTEMNDTEADGMLLFGLAGCGKTEIAKAIANEWGVPLVIMDFSGMKGSKVGESGAAIRQALKSIRAMAEGDVMYLATCNNMGSIPPEFRRRFQSGTFFFDLPGKEAREAIWTLYEKKFNVGGQRPTDDGWTPAEIKNCCSQAYRLQCSLKEAAGYIVPIAKSSAERIAQMRSEANGRFISASRVGFYTHEEKNAAIAKSGRAIS